MTAAPAVVPAAPAAVPPENAPTAPPAENAASAASAVSAVSAVASPGLPPEALSRAFPFHLWLDDELRVRAFGASLAKVLPELEAGQPLARHLEVRRPAAAVDAAAWRRHGRAMCTLRGTRRAALHLRGAAEFPAEGGILLLVAPVLTSLDAVRELGLAFDDFAPHDAAGELLLLARSTQASLKDAQGMAARLRARSQQLDSVVELCEDGVAFCDAGGTLRHANAALHALLGLERGSLVGRPLAALEAELQARVDATEPPGAPVFALHAPDSPAPMTFALRSPRHAIVVAASRRSPDGGRAFYLHDVTAATEVDRMKSEFLTTAAHELRTPMVSVHGFTELLLHRPVGDERRRDMLETIHRQSTRLIAMLNELLDLARIEARRGRDLRCAPHAAAPLVADAVGPLAARGSHAIEMRVAPDAPVVRVDADKTHRALTNVLSNALKYSAPGTTVVVDTVAGRLADGGPALGVRVADRGIGMSPSQLARVFERFWRADPSGHVPGTGLGMSLVKEIAELQGGRVDVASTFGEGTTVTLWLPLAGGPGVT